MGRPSIREGGLYTGNDLAGFGVRQGKLSEGFQVWYAVGYPGDIGGNVNGLG
jgi:hypothetical protein